jgi:hypothetical protein
VAARVRGANQGDSGSPLGFASCRPELRIPPAVRRIIFIEAVLPALVPDMTYAGMEVADGVDAGLAWELLIRCTGDQSEPERIRKALLGYCRQDTLALVRLLETLILKSRRATGQ